MLQFPVPQFIDVEDKIIGPFTLKQFGFIFGGGLIIVAFFRILGNNIFFYILSVPVGIVTVALAFLHFNGRRLYDTFPIFYNFAISDKAYIFKKENNDQEIDAKLLSKDIVAKATPVGAAPIEPVQNRLKQISQLLDRKDIEENETLNK